MFFVTKTDYISEKIEFTSEEIKIFSLFHSTVFERKDEDEFQIKMLQESNSAKTARSWTLKRMRSQN